MTAGMGEVYTPRGVITEVGFGFSSNGCGTCLDSMLEFRTGLDWFYTEHLGNGWHLSRLYLVCSFNVLSMSMELG